MKLVFVTGISGSGKSTLAEEFTEHSIVINCDPLAKYISELYLPQIQPKKGGGGVINQLFKIPKFREALNPIEFSIAPYIQSLISKSHLPDDTIIFEGVWLRFPLWREGILDALRLLHKNVEHPISAAFLNPAPETVYSQYNNRAAKNRKNAPPTSLEKITKQQKTFKSDLDSSEIEFVEFSNPKDAHQFISDAIEASF